MRFAAIVDHGDDVSNRVVGVAEILQALSVGCA